MRTIARIGFGLLLGLCLIEVGVRALPPLLGAKGDAPAAWLGLPGRVLCLGDSVTYGIWLDDRGQSFPAQLERLWNASGDRRPIEVFNLGYPGTNSSQTRRDLPRMLSTFQPDAVVVMVGANDAWTVPVEIGEPPALRAPVEFLRRHSRLYQLVVAIERRTDDRRLEVERDVGRDGGRSGAIRYGEEVFPMGYKRAKRRADNNTKLLENLRAIVATIRAANAEPVFATYPSRAANEGESGQYLRVVAIETHTPVVDLATTFMTLCPTEPCPEWLRKDHHPTPRGNERIGALLVEALREVL